MADPRQSQTLDNAPLLPTKRLRQCTCGATVFQGPFPVGEFVDGKFVKREDQWRCMNCNTVRSAAEMGALAEREVQTGA